MPDPPIDKLLLIVVGSHPRAEVADRPVAYDLGHRMEQWLGAHAEADPPDLQPLVLSDVWYLNHAELHRRPALSLGGPEVNALSAYFYPRLPRTLEVEQRLVIQVDPQWLDLRAAVWGADGPQTRAAVDLFRQRYMEDYLQACAARLPAGD